MLDTSKIPTKRVDGYYTHITNCITKIPQNIKLELVNGTLTLKAGSKVYIPNGDNIFNPLTTNSDIDLTLSLQASTSYFLFATAGTNGLSANGVYRQTISNTSSGSSVPTGGVFYDTTNNKITAVTGGVQETTLMSFPVCVFTTDTNGQIISIDQIFNGFGYIGNIIFVLPGVEGIIPNGFNEDGSIKNIHCQIEEVQTKQIINDWNNHWYVHLMGENSIEYHPWELYYNQVDKPMSVGQTAFWYNPNEKIVQSTDDYGTTWNTAKQVTPFLEVFQNEETITSIKPINVYENITSKTVENKFKVVSELPSFPEVGVFYFVKE